MKEYFVIHYHNPDGENRYFTDPTFYPTEADARAHIKKDVYAMIERYEYSNSDLLKEIFNAFCTNTDCEKCHFYDNCYRGNRYAGFYSLYFAVHGSPPKSGCARRR